MGVVILVRLIVYEIVGRFPEYPQSLNEAKQSILVLPSTAVVLHGRTICSYDPTVLIVVLLCLPSDNV